MTPQEAVEIAEAQTQAGLRKLWAGLAWSAFSALKFLLQAASAVELVVLITTENAARGQAAAAVEVSAHRQVPSELKKPQWWL